MLWHLAYPILALGPHLVESERGLIAAARGRIGCHIDLNWAGEREARSSAKPMIRHQDRKQDEIQMQALRKVGSDGDAAAPSSGGCPRLLRARRQFRIALAAVLSAGLITAASAGSPAAEPGRIEAELAAVRARLDELLDREAIRQLAVSYAHFARTRSIDALVALYSSDAVLDVPGNMGTTAGARSGHEAIRETLRVDLPRADPWPFLHQHYIEMLGHDRARGVLYFELRLGVENLRVTHIGSYMDEYVREDGVWKFRSRKLAAIPVSAAAIPGN